MKGNQAAPSGMEVEEISLGRELCSRGAYTESSRRGRERLGPLLVDGNIIAMPFEA